MCPFESVYANEVVFGQVKAKRVSWPANAQKHLTNGALGENAAEDASEPNRVTWARRKPPPLRVSRQAQEFPARGNARRLRHKMATWREVTRRWYWPVAESDVAWKCAIECRLAAIFRSWSWRAFLSAFLDCRCASAPRIVLPSRRNSCPSPYEESFARTC